MINDVINPAISVMQSLWAFKAEVSLLITFILVIIADLVFKKDKKPLAHLTIIGCMVAGGFLYSLKGTDYFIWDNAVAVDSFASFFKYLILLSTIIVVIMSFYSKELINSEVRLGEYYTLILGMAFGMFILVGATNLILIYLAIETMSMSSYVLAGYTKQIKRSSEASLKYVIFGSLASGVMIYGVSILFGLTGSLNLYDINYFLLNNAYNKIPVIISGLMILVGIGYKISAVPFHFWTPDVYEGSPVTITAYLSVASKAAGFAILARLIKAGFFDPLLSNTGVWTSVQSMPWAEIIAVLAVITMTVGNTIALWQSNVKRMLAYSSIAHAGYLLMGIVVMSNLGLMSILMYFFFYLLMNFGAFFVVMLFANKIDSEELDDYTGIGYRAPILATLLTVFLVSLTGLPPTAGFIGKLYLFTAVLKEGWIWLAVIGVLNSVVSLYYYAKVIRNMWLRGVDNTNEKLEYSYSSQFWVFVLAVPTVLFGVYFGPIVKWAEYSVSLLVK